MVRRKVEQGVDVDEMKVNEMAKQNTDETRVIIKSINANAYADVIEIDERNLLRLRKVIFRKP